jgi:hypothetical protein
MELMQLATVFVAGSGSMAMLPCAAAVGPLLTLRAAAAAVVDCLLAAVPAAAAAAAAAAGGVDAGVVVAEMLPGLMDRPCSCRYCWAFWRLSWDCCFRYCTGNRLTTADATGNQTT